MPRGILIALWVAAAAALIGVTGMWLATRDQAGGIAAGQPLGGSFELTEAGGAPITEAALRGKPTALFFGFTHCPDVCPTTLAEMAGWMEALGEKAAKMKFVFMTVDPERDQPGPLHDYLGAFDPRITGITGEPEKVRETLDDFHVYYRKVATEDGDYTMDHTASIFLLDAKGRLAGTISFDESEANALAKLRALLDG
ncbi:cytochrome c oxidase assembly protein [Afifella sp. IM 167]|nr:cytochrome c oxidase assembly protein [Afifella sp. IM 167]